MSKSAFVAFMTELHKMVFTPSKEFLAYNKELIISFYHKSIDRVMNDIVQVKDEYNFQNYMDSIFWTGNPDWGSFYDFLCQEKIIISL